jgi:hypothetical protein
MDYGQAFTFIPNSSKDWITKAAMGVVFAVAVIFLGVGVIGLLGWSVAIARRVIRGEADPLPEWSELSTIIVDGLKLLVLVIAWLIPLWILSIVGAVIDNGVVSFILWCCSAIYGIPMGLLIVGAIGMLADDQPFSEVINPMNSYRIVSTNWANVIIVLIVAGITYSLATTVGSILCGIGIFVGLPYGYAVGGHLYGQLYREAQGKLALG